jgi:SAM-dependent methyltransferase
MPIETLYSDEIAPWYDMYVHDEPLNINLKFIIKIFRKFKVKNFIDISCGTGNYIIPLYKNGFRGVGVDLEPAMIKEAKRKCKIKKLKIKFHVQDMKKLNIGGKYDAIIIPGAGFSYICSSRESLKTLKAFRKHVKNGGVIILDTIYSKNTPKKKIDIENVSSGKISYEVLHEYYTDKKNEFIFVKCIHKRFVGRKQLPTISDRKFVRLRMYVPGSIKKLLIKSGFEPVFLYGSYKGEKFLKSSDRLITVAKAV